MWIHFIKNIRKVRIFISKLETNECLFIKKIYRDKYLFKIRVSISIFGLSGKISIILPKIINE